MKVIRGPGPIGGAMYPVSLNWHGRSVSIVKLPIWAGCWDLGPKVWVVDYQDQLPSDIPEGTRIAFKAGLIDEFEVP